MKILFGALLLSLPLAADTTAIDISSPVIVFQSGLNAQFTPVISETPDGFSVSMTYGFSQPQTEVILELEETFTLTEAAMVATNYSAAALLFGGACTHGACPGMNVGISGFSQIEPVTPVYISGSGTSSTPYLGEAQASATNAGEWLLNAGTYTVFQYVNFSASDAGISSIFEPSLTFSITDPPSAVPEPRGTALGIATLMAGVLFGLRAKSKTRLKAATSHL